MTWTRAAFIKMLEKGGRNLAKIFKTLFFPGGDGILAIVVDSVSFLRTENYGEMTIRSSHNANCARGVSPVRSNRPGKESLERQFAESVSECRRRSTRNDRSLVV
jgi:hypothetical protein